MKHLISIELSATNAKEKGFSFKEHFNSFNQVIPEPNCLSKTISGSALTQTNQVFEENRSFLQLMIKSKSGSMPINHRLELFKRYKTKEDMDAQIIEDDTILFMVPWCLPYDALRALFKKYPDVEFQGTFAEEAMFFTGSFDRNDFYYANDKSNRMYEIYFKHFGSKKEVA